MAGHPDDEDRDDEDRTAIGDLTAIKVANRRDRAHLIVLAGGSLGQMFRVDKNETVIGRAADANIRKFLDEKGLAHTFDLKRQLRAVDAIFKRVFGAGKSSAAR